MKSRLLFLLIPVLIAGFVLRPQSRTQLPTTMEGKWVTDDSRYQGRFFKLSQASIIFGTGESNIDVFFITDVKAETRGQDLVYHLIIHRAGEDESQISVVYNDTENSALKLLNQPQMKWTKVEENISSSI